LWGELLCIADFASDVLSGGRVANLDHSQPDAFLELSSVGATPITSDNQIRIDGQDLFGTWPDFFMTGCAVSHVGELSICVFGHRGDARWFNELQHKLISTIVETGDFVVILWAVDSLT